MLKQKVRFVLPALLAALATLLAMSPARADIWSGSWDPQYGAPFTPVPFGYNLGWGGKVKVNDDACTVPFGGGTFTNAGACGGGAFVVPGTLIVTLYGHPNLTPVDNTQRQRSHTLWK